jgi:hypothetical protein
MLQTLPSVTPDVVLTDDRSGSSRLAIVRIREGGSGQQNGPLSDLGRAGQPIHAEPRLIAVKRQLGLVD